jgi:hypothetical protein
MGSSEEEIEMEASGEEDDVRSSAIDGRERERRHMIKKIEIQTRIFMVSLPY